MALAQHSPWVVWATLRSALVPPPLRQGVPGAGAESPLRTSGRSFVAMPRFVRPDTEEAHKTSPGEVPNHMQL